MVKLDFNITLMHTSLTNQTPVPASLCSCKSVPEKQNSQAGQPFQKLYAEVVVNIPLNKTFHYSIPVHLRDNLAPGMRVKIPFGKKITTGFCVGFTDTPFPYQIKDIINIIDKTPLADDVMLRITKWLSFHYCCGWGEAINAVIPPVARRSVKEKEELFVTPCDALTNLDQKILAQLKTRAPKQAKVLDFFSEHFQEISSKELIQISDCKMPGLRQLEKKGFLAIQKKPQHEVGTPSDFGPFQQHLTFTEEQQNAFDVINKRLALPDPGVVLLHGITGSGKTEVYLQTIAKVLEQGRKAIFLVPEISLTSQTIQRIKARFNNVAILHSHLLGTFHYSQWNDIKEGKIDIVIGARSSIFAPLKKVGLVIIDEEHENTYKQENSPRYNARDVAILRAACDNALVLLGSATPSLETYYQATLGNYEKIVLSKRIGSQQLPPIEIVDMSEEVRKRRGHHILSQRLEFYMNQALSRNEQVILFLNRRGFAPYLHCKRCGFVLKCRKCDIPMTFHKKLNTALCHYCHAETPPMESCPDCMTGKINYRGYGTEKIEEEIIARFPQYKILRMDSDTMRVRNAHEKALTAFERGDVHILLGTQMIAKGLDFPNVTLVGVISADTILNLPDFRASERTFQLISQVAGRTGRGPKGGRVVVQSFNPRHYSITYAATHDYDEFAKKEMEYRKQLNYPPYGKLARIVFRSQNEDKVREKSSVVADKLKEITKANGGNLEILGPSPAPVTKINNMFRWHLLLRSQDHSHIHNALGKISEMLKPSKSVQAIVDVDPYMML